MKKYLALLAILMSAAVKTYSQNDNTQTKLGVGFSGGGALGSVSSAYPVGFELNLRAEFPLEGSPVSLTLNTGLTFYTSSNGYEVEYGDGEDYSTGSVAVFLPVQAGARVYATHRLFFEGDIGGSLNLNSPYSEFTSQRVALLVTPQAGYTISFGSTRASLDLSVFYENRLESGGGYQQIGGRVAFNFGLGEKQ
jgi:hypothetical protein